MSDVRASEEFMSFEDTKSVEVNGRRLAYLEQGRGDPVVFVHGDISDLRMWRPQLHAFGPEYRAVAYSRRYARPNAEIEPRRADPILDHAADLEALLHALDLAPAHLVGNS